MWIIPLSSARSDRGFSGRNRSAIIAVLVTRGSATISVLLRICFQMLAKNRMVLGDVGADQKDDIGFLQIFVGARRPIAAERSLVAGDRGGHAQRRVAVVVVRAEAKLHQFAQRVELFGDQLAGADHAERVAAVSLPAWRGNFSTIVSRASSQLTRYQLAVLAQQRILRAVRRFERVVLRQAPWDRAFRDSPDDSGCRAR